MFDNSFGKITFNGDKLRFDLNNEFVKSDFDEFIENLDKIYNQIDREFYIITDLSKVNISWTTYKKYYPIIDTFTKNYQISERYLKNITVINSNKVLVKILNWIFYIYGMKHEISFIEKELITNEKNINDILDEIIDEALI